MSSAIKICDLNSETLRVLWRGDIPPGVRIDDLPPRWREEALWTYWQRVAVGQEPLDEDALGAAIESGVGGLGNVIGHLAMTNRLGKFDRALLRRFLHAQKTDDAVWGLSQLNAREAAELIVARAMPQVSFLMEFLLVKGVSEILLQVLDHLSTHERAYVAEIVTLRGVLTKGQRQAIHQRIVALAQDPVRGH